MKRAIYYHAGCAVCVSVEQEILNLLDRSKYALEVVHLGTQNERLAEAELAGVQSVPALVLEGGTVLHINFGASLEALKPALHTA